MSVGHGTSQPGVSKRVRVGSVEVDSLREGEIVEHVLAALDVQRGGWIVTPNVDIARSAARDPAAARLVASADLAIPDGVPLLWAARLADTPLPARVTGASLLWSLSAGAAEQGRSVYLLGGASGVPDAAGEALRARYPELVVAGAYSPPFGFDADQSQVTEVCERVREAKPDIVFVGMGFPRQERMIARLREHLPNAWYLACGAAIGFAAGVQRRAPDWMQRTGLEWLHRLACEPRRMARRYLVNDVPYAVGLLGRASWNSIGRRISR